MHPILPPSDLPHSSSNMTIFNNSAPNNSPGGSETKTTTRASAPPGELLKAHSIFNNSLNNSLAKIWTPNFRHFSTTRAASCGNRVSITRLQFFASSPSLAFFGKSWGPRQPAGLFWPGAVRAFHWSAVGALRRGDRRGEAAVHVE